HPGDERRYSHAPADPDFPLTLRFPLEAAVGCIDVGVHAGLDLGDQLRRIVAERTNDETDPPVRRRGRGDRERMRLAQPVRLHTQEPEVARVEPRPVAYRLELDLGRAGSARDLDDPVVTVARH